MGGYNHYNIIFNNLFKTFYWRVDEDCGDYLLDDHRQESFDRIAAHPVLVNLHEIGKSFQGFFFPIINP